ncbi:MAG: GntR family transcriptional regulator [Marinifilum sp.]|jgi:DNA-binding FadR family transcriptional regulator|nr:GntR family transcriptional regulator [Marinifilum sp.]
MLNANLRLSQKPSLVDQVESKLLSHFREMSLKPGDTLPGELELKDALGVGRSVLREALSRFRMVGLVESKPGRGMILREPALFNGLERVMNPHMLSHNKLMDLLGFRVMIELGAVDFIFENVTTQDIHDLEKIIERQVVFENNQFTPQSDYEFHVRLLQIANNESVQQFQNILYPIFVFTKENFNLFMQQNERVNPVTHQQLFELLKKGDKESYRTAMKEHLHLYFDLIKSNGK